MTPLPLGCDENNLKKKKSDNYTDSPSNSPPLAATALGATGYKQPSFPSKQLLSLFVRGLNAALRTPARA